MASPNVQPSTPTPTGVYHNLRRAILELVPAEAGLKPTPAAPHVWGVLTEMSYPKSVVTLVCLVDGTTSLYFSAGGGILGSGQHRSVAQAGETLVETAERALAALRPTSACSLPAAGQVQFIVLTYEGKWIASATEQELVNGHHRLSALFDGAQEVITQIRLLEIGDNSSNNN